jgi:amidohydrolase
MKRMSLNIADANNAEIEAFKYVKSTPVVSNNPELVQKTLPVIKEVVGSQNVILPQPSMGGEDFELFMEKVPGFFFRLGIRNREKGITPSALHTADLMVDEDAIIVGVKVMSNILVDYLERESK